MQRPSFIPVPTVLSTLLFITTITTAIFTSLLPLFYYCYFYKTVATDKPLRARLLSGAAELTTHLLRLISILWIPLCRINKLGFTTLEDCGDPIYLWVINTLHTHTHRQHYIRPRCTKVKQGSNHGTVYLLIHIFTIGIRIKMTLGGNWSRSSFEVRHIESFEHVLEIFSLVDEGSFSQLFGLKTKKELHLSHHRHLKPVSHKL